MSDLIDRQAAIDAIRKSASDFSGFMEMEMYTDDDAVEAIEGLPPAEPVRHGKWIKGSETKRIKENRYGVLFDAYYCSACESEAYWDTDYGQILFHYCPNCGARMDVE